MKSLPNPVIKAEERRSLNQRGPPNIVEVKGVCFEGDKMFLKRRELIYMSVESERELNRRLRAKEDAAKPWYFTHV